MMEIVYVSRLLEDVPSKDRQGHLHRAGTEIAPVKKLEGDRWLIEIRTAEGDGFWYEQLEINADQSGIMEESRESMGDNLYDPETGRPPVDPNDLRDPTSIPMWSIGGFGRPVEDDDKSGLSEIEARILGRLEETYQRLQRAERGSRYWGELLHECRGIKIAWDSLYAYPWREAKTKPESESHSWNNEGCTHQGWRLQLDWQARLY